MVDEVAFVMQGGVSASVAGMASFSAGGTSVKKDGDALLRVSQALYGLVGCLLSSVEEFRALEHALELEITPELSGSVEEARPELLLGIPGALKEMVGALVSDIKANPQVQQLMPAIQKGSLAKQHGAIFQDWMNFPKQQRRSCSGNDASPEETVVSVRVRDSRMAKRIAGKGQMSVCKHICEHHAEVVDPWVWGNLPRELVELVFAKLPLPRIIELRKCSKGMPRMICKTSDFRGACSESHPVLFGLLGWDAHHESLGTRLLDVKSKEWLFVELAGLPGAVSTTRCEPAHYCRWIDSMPDDDWNHVYMNSMFACDGGLVCFVPSKHLASYPVLVCNPFQDQCLENPSSYTSGGL
jgi:hypothetical protein